MTVTAQWRDARAAAYHAGRYRFRPPPVYSGNWDTRAWCNWVVFDDPTLNGFDDGRPVCRMVSDVT